jgi:hypothetical protein
MSPRWLPRFAIVLVVLGWLSGCTPPGGERPLIGELGTSGVNVLRNGLPAAVGTRIYSGDSVTTGPNSSAMILFANGGISNSIKTPIHSSPGQQLQECAASL